MSKEVKKAIALLDEKEIQTRELIAKAEADLNATNAKLSDLRARLNNADSADQYKELIHEIRDNEAVLSFCEKRIKSLKESTLTPDEYKIILAEITRSFGDVQVEYFKQVKTEVDKLLKILSSYDNEVAELNSALSRVNSTQATASFNVLNPRDMVKDRFDLCDPYRLFVDTYYRMQASRMTIERYS